MRSKIPGLERLRAIMHGAADERGILRVSEQVLSDLSEAKPRTFLEATSIRRCGRVVGTLLVDLGLVQEANLPSSKRWLARLPPEFTAIGRRLRERSLPLKMLEEKRKLIRQRQFRENAAELAPIDREIAKLLASGARATPKRGDG